MPDQISWPPLWWRSAINRVTMLRVTLEAHRDRRPRCEWKAISRGQCRNLSDASCREARAVVPRASSSLRICVQERIAAQQYSSQIEGMLRPMSSRKACSPVLGKVGDRFQIRLDMPFNSESTSRMACGERTMRRWVCDVLEWAPYSKRRCFMWG